MLKKYREPFIACESSYESAEIVLFGAPFDSTTSYRPGTRFGPKAIRNESFGLETYSPYQDSDLSDGKVYDGGDLDLPFGNTSEVISQIEYCAQSIIQDEKFPFMLGGEHLVTLGTIRALAKRYPDLHILQFDAHADLRNDYLGSKLSHASVIRRVHDLLGDGRIHQLGIRSGEKEEFSFARQHTVLYPFSLDHIDEAISALKGKPVYFTLDLDVLDPSCFPGTGTPEAGGISFKELLDKTIKVIESLTLVGCDVNELSPVYDQSGVSTITACKMVREMLIGLTKKKKEIQL